MQRFLNQKAGTSGDVGIWHETYMCANQRYESVYEPAFGLGKAGQLVPATGRKQSAAERLQGNPE